MRHTIMIEKQTSPGLIYGAAEHAAQEAARIADQAIGIPEVQRGLDCGFAWVVVRPAKGPFIKWCKQNGKGSKHHTAGWCFWKPGHANTQSISVHEAGARAFAEVLKAHGIDATYDSRLD